jgi:hypothetical protein
MCEPQATLCVPGPRSVRVCVVSQGPSFRRDFEAPLVHPLCETWSAVTDAAHRAIQQEIARPVRVSASSLGQTCPPAASGFRAAAVTCYVPCWREVSTVLGGASFSARNRDSDSDGGTWDWEAASLAHAQCEASMIRFNSAGGNDREHDKLLGAMSKCGAHERLLLLRRPR